MPWSFFLLKIPHTTPSVELPTYGCSHLDEEKTLTVLLEQLGPTFAGFEAFTPSRRALAGAFIAYAGGDKKECVGILDAVANSYVEEKGAAVCPVLERKDFAKRLITVWKRNQVIVSEKSLTRHAAYELPWFMALLTRARQKGVLASSQFLWVRPLDRALWYALNQCGGRAAWAEAFAAWAHYAAEEKAGRALHEPHVVPAVASLRDSLSGQGWLADTARRCEGPQVMSQATPDSSDDSEAASAGSGAAGIEPMPDLVLADAEDDLEMYDANSDPYLAQEQY